MYRIPHPALDDAVRKAIPDAKVVFVDTKLNAKQQSEQGPVSSLNGDVMPSPTLASGPR